MISSFWDFPVLICYLLLLYIIVKLITTAIIITIDQAKTYLKERNKNYEHGRQTKK